MQEMWNTLWRSIENQRKILQHSWNRPRLETVTVAAQSPPFPTPRSLSASARYPQESALSQQAMALLHPFFDNLMVHFEARLSERCELAAKGIASIICLELEGLEHKLALESDMNTWQRTLLREMRARAEHGPSSDFRTCAGEGADALTRPLKTRLLEMASV